MGDPTIGGAWKFPLTFRATEKSCLSIDQLTDPENILRYFSRGLSSSRRNHHFFSGGNDFQGIYFPKIFPGTLFFFLYGKKPTTAPSKIHWKTSMSFSKIFVTPFECGHLEIHPITFTKGCRPEKTLREWWIHTLETETFVTSLSHTFCAVCPCTNSGLAPEDVAKKKKTEDGAWRKKMLATESEEW